LLEAELGKDFVLGGDAFDAIDPDGALLLEELLHHRRMILRSFWPPRSALVALLELMLDRRVAASLLHFGRRAWGR
jgi:hypothetical protein